MAYMRVRITKNKKKNYKRLKKGGIALEQFALINVRVKYQLYKERIIFFSIFLPVSILLFFSGAILSPITMNFHFMIFTGIGFFLMVIVTVTGAVAMERRSILHFLIETIKEVEKSDSVNIKDLFLTPYLGEKRTELIVQRLIKSKNLEDYEIIDNLIAKKSLGLKPEDTKKEKSSEPEKPLKIIRSRCLKCNSLIEGNPKFCAHCGEEL